MKNDVCKQIVTLLRDGEKPKESWRIGLEVEHLIIDNHTGLAVPYGGQSGIGSMLSAMSASASAAHGETEEGLIELVFEEYTLSLESGAQIEFSLNPYRCLDDICKVYEKARLHLDSVLRQYDCHALCVGYLPKGSVDDIDIVPKRRYMALWDLFQKTGTLGRNMMRGSASIQFSIDYASEEDFVRKFQILYLLSPLFFLVTFNTPFFEGQKNTHLLKRYQLWEQTDAKRTGIVPGLFDTDFGYQKYAEYALHNPLYFCEEGANPAVQHLVQIYPFVRAKGNYIEVRFADSMPKDYFMAYLAFCKCLLESERTTKEILAAFPHDEESLRAAYQAVDKRGYRASIYSKPVTYWLDFIQMKICNIADDNQLQYMKPLYDLIRNRMFIFDKEGV